MSQHINKLYANIKFTQLINLKYQPCLSSQLTAQPRTSCNSLPSSVMSRFSTIALILGIGNPEISIVKTYNEETKQAF